MRCGSSKEGGERAPVRCSGSECVLAGFAGADADDLLQRGHEDLAVADLAGACRRFDGFDDAVEDGLVHGGFDLDLGQEVDHVLCTTVQLGVALLTAEALDFGHGDALDADGGQGLTHFIKLEGLDDGGHHFHGWFSGEVGKRMDCEVTACSMPGVGPRPCHGGWSLSMHISVRARNRCARWGAAGRLVAHQCGDSLLVGSVRDTRRGQNDPFCIAQAAQPCHSPSSAASPSMAWPPPKSPLRCTWPMVCRPSPWSAWPTPRSRKPASACGRRWPARGWPSPTTSASPSTWLPRTCPRSRGVSTCPSRSASWRRWARSRWRTSTGWRWPASCRWAGACARSGARWPWLCRSGGVGHRPWPWGWCCRPPVRARRRWSRACRSGAQAA